MSLASAPSSRPPSASPQLAAFVQALRAGLHDGLRAALDAAAEALDQAQARTLTPIERAGLSDLQGLLRSRRAAWMPRLLQSLEEALEEELGERRIEAHGAEASERALTLLDEESIDEDIWHPSKYDFTYPDVQDQWGTANQMDEFVAKKSFNDPDQGLFVAPPV